MPTTLTTSKEELKAAAQKQMAEVLKDETWSTTEKLALTCRILFDGGHDSGIVGQITARAGDANTYYTQPFGRGFDEIRSSHLIRVDQDLEKLEGTGMPNPANRFHTWVYRARPDVNCIVHTHAFYSSTLAILEKPLIVSQMDLCPLFEQVAFLEKWPGIPVGNEEGEIISAALGDKKAILLSHHGLLVTGSSVEEACVLSLLFEKAAKMQLTALAAGEIRQIPELLGLEAQQWTSTPKRFSLAFDYYARRALRTHSDCLV